MVSPVSSPILENRRRFSDTEEKKMEEQMGPATSC